MWLPRPEYGASVGNYSHAEVFPVNVEIREKTIQSEEESRGDILVSPIFHSPAFFRVSLWLNRSGSQGAGEPGKCSFHSAMREVLQTGKGPAYLASPKTWIFVYLHGLIDLYLKWSLTSNV